MKSLKKFNRCFIILLLVALIVLAAGCSKQDNTNEEVTYIVEPIPEVEPITIGQPTKEYYPVNTIPRCIWDMEIFDNTLYIGNGDYDKNAGPVPALRMSLDNIGNWEKMGFLSDEQIGRFKVIDGKLTIPGWDPCGWAKYGTYYQLENGAWKTHSGILDNLHNFDLTEFEGKLFASIGAKVGKTPIIVSSGDDKFERVPMIKNGKPMEPGKGEVVRSHNLYTFGGKLYADFYYYDPTDTSSLRFEMYRYENESFNFVCNLLDKLDFKTMGCIYKMKIMENQSLNDRLFLVTDRLYYTDDMNTFKEITLLKNSDKSVRAFDLYKYNDVLYILAYSSDDEGTDFEISISSIKDGKNPKVKTECYFHSELLPTCFAVSDKNFFVAVGKWTEECEDNGTVLQIERE
ncbi:MAG: hypothetical protein KBS52_02215 [Clostridiales bacterium]|nr:hypothetical protein [Candidatus Equinaster intestinalis]